MFRWRPLRGEDIELCRRRVARAKHGVWLAEVDLARFERRLAHGQLPGLTPAMAAHCRIILQRAVRTATQRYDEAIEDLRRVRDDQQFRRAHHLRRAA